LDVLAHQDGAAPVSALVAIIDIGKTHAKLVLIDAASGLEVFSTKRRNVSLDTDIGKQLDVIAIEGWLIESLRSSMMSEQIVSVIPIAHGATAVLIDGAGEILATPDYEDSGFSETDAEYERARDAFAATLSPSLPCGLNLARQLFYLQRQEPGLFARVAHVLLYPQYWAWRLSGAMASEVTSLGCHTDLWRPQEARYSHLVESRGWGRLFPPLRNAGDALGSVTPAIAAATGLSRSCAVRCGIHDSNASYLEYLIDRPREEPFTVISSGTWTVVMARHADLSRLRAERDMLANVDAFGSPTATARFMGGREYEAIAQGSTPPTDAGLELVLEAEAFAIPCFATAGPFNAARGRLLNAERLNLQARAALASAYCALMCDLLLDSLDARGSVIVDGPLASNLLFLRLLASWRPQASIRANASVQSVCARAALFLSDMPTGAMLSLSECAPLSVTGLSNYRARWRELLPAPR
jgi:sugar (pentulose or hexulose) kinase